MRKLIEYLEEKFFKLTFLHVLFFAFVWLMLGLSTGLAIFMGPVRYFVTHFRETFQTDFVEDWTVRIIIVLFVVGSAFLSAMMVRVFIRTTRLEVKGAVLGFSLLTGLSTIFLMMHPNEYEMVTDEMGVFNAQFTFGGYPDKEKMIELKEQGYTAIITHLETNVIPFEHELYKKEEENAEAVGIGLIHLPMLPWLGTTQNQNAIEAVKKLAESGEGRYYVHCYLGMDRIRLIQKAVASVSPHVPIDSSIAHKQLGDIRKFKRGDVQEIAHEAYLSPPPSLSEIPSYLFSTELANVVSLIDPRMLNRINGLSDEESYFTDPDGILQEHVLPFRADPIQNEAFNPISYQSIASDVKKLERPVLIISDHDRPELTSAFREAFRFGVPPLLSSRFQTPLLAGEMALVFPNTLYGPKPTQGELSNYLAREGIRNVLFLGKRESAEAIEGRRNAAHAGLKWFARNANRKKVARITRKDGPWYVYGKGISAPAIFTTKELRRGPIERLDTRFFIIPVPSESEIKPLFEDEFIRKVVAIKRKGPKPDWLKSERKLLRKLGIRFEVYPIVVDPYHSGALKDVVHKLWKSKQPVAIQIDRDDKLLYQAFMQAVCTDVPALPPALFRTFFMERGEVEVIAPNIAVGPRPTESEFKKLVSEGGIEKFIYLGRDHFDLALDDAQITKKLKLDWRVIEPNPKTFLSYVAHGGPWYLYGPDLDEVNESLKARLAPVVPKRIYNYPEQWYINLIDFLPTRVEWKQLILSAPFLVIYVILASLLSGYLRQEKGLSVAYTRKSFHFLIFLFAGMLKLFGNIPLLLFFSGIVSIFVLYGVWRGHGFPLFDVLARPSDEPHPARFIVIPWLTTALGGMTSLLLFGDFVSVGIFVCGFGDAVGEVAGRRWGKHKYKVASLFGTPAVRSYEGSFAVFVMSTFAAVFTLFFMGLDPLSALWVGLVTGFIGAVIEGLTNHGLDNFTVQVGASAVSYGIVEYMGLLIN